MREWTIVAAALALAACGQAPTNAPAASSHPAQSLDAASAAAKAASDKFVALASGSQTSGLPPRQTDPAAGPLLDAVFDTSAVPTTDPPFSKLTAVNDWLLAANKVGVTYVLAGTGQSTFADSPTVDAQVGRNVGTFAPEIGRYLDAECVLLGTEAGIVSDDLAANPTAFNDPARADGLAKMRGGVLQATGGFIQTIAGAQNGEDWKLARMKPLIAMAPNAARLLAPDARADLAAKATAAATDTGDLQLKSDFTQFATKISSPGS